MIVQNNALANMIAAALLWSTWKMRNDTFFGHILVQCAGCVAAPAPFTKTLAGALPQEGCAAAGQMSPAYGRQGEGSSPAQAIVKKRRTAQLLGPGTPEAMEPRMLLKMAF